MAEISAAMVKELREKTGSGIMDCKKALKESDGDVEKALEFLRKKGLAAAAKRSARATSEGTIMSYIHMGGKIGVMVEVNCETDFVAKNEDFQAFAKDVAMHIAAVNPAGLAPEDIPEEVVAKEREIYRERALEQGKPENIVDKIVDGQVQKFYKDACLLSQAYVKNPQITVEDYLKEVIGKMGENIRISRFVRYQLGE
ncbi:MAG: translation elongation factor Ts [Desulfobacterales bacterium]|nr:translation elongation factor Ts [Desulfobacterales bacterium]